MRSCQQHIRELFKTMFYNIAPSLNLVFDVSHFAQSFFFGVIIYRQLVFFFCIFQFFHHMCHGDVSLFSTFELIAPLMRLQQDDHMSLIGNIARKKKANLNSSVFKMCKIFIPQVTTTFFQLLLIHLFRRSCLSKLTYLYVQQYEKQMKSMNPMTFETFSIKCWLIIGLQHYCYREVNIHDNNLYQRLQVLS